MSDKPTDPIAASRRLVRPELPRRFYETATAEPHTAGFALMLDGRLARTPARNPLAVASRTVAEALAAEWGSQGERLDPATMPITRIVNAAIDRVQGEMGTVRDDIVKYSGSDLLCYRADGPRSLIDAEEGAWSPLLAWARAALGARFILAEGIVAVQQPPATLAAIGKALAPLDALTLAALHVATTLTGSAIVALAVLHGRLTPEEAWAAAHVDEDWQMQQWGADETVLARRAFRWREMEAAAAILGRSR